MSCHVLLSCMDLSSFDLLDLATAVRVQVFCLQMVLVRVVIGVAVSVKAVLQLADALQLLGSHKQIFFI